MRRTHYEYISSGLPLRTEVMQMSLNFSEGPTNDIMSTLLVACALRWSILISRVDQGFAREPRGKKQRFRE
jgi:hypothetical protein